MKSAFTMFPTSTLHTSAQGPKPAIASATATTAPVRNPAVSTISRSFCMKSRVMSADGTAVSASISTDSVSTRRTFVASGASSASATCGAARNIATHRTRLEPKASVFTVGAIRETSPGLRTIARLTPSSFMLSRALSATSATA
jgi:hypothetical protein